MELSTKLIISVLMDIIGMGTYAVPWLAELGDIIFAPIQAAWIWYAYGSVKGAVLGGVEELLPFTDIIPSCTIMHFVYMRKETNHPDKDSLEVDITDW